MKIAFVVMSLMCAAALGLLSYVWVTGKIPFKAAAAVESAAQTNAVMEEKGLRIPMDEKLEVQALVNLLKAERKTLEQQKTKMETDQGKDKLTAQIKLLEQLKTDIEAQKVLLEKDMQGMDAAERKNLQLVAENFAKMEPANAATLLKAMDRRRAAMMVSMMENRQAAAILDEMTLQGEDGKKVAVEWVEIIRKIKDEDNRKKQQAEQGEATP